MPALQGGKVKGIEKGVVEQRKADMHFGVASKVPVSTNPASQKLQRSIWKRSHLESADSQSD